MNAGDLVDRAASAGVVLIPAARDRVVFRVPNGGDVAPDLLADLRANKVAVLRELERRTVHGVTFTDLRREAGDDWDSMLEDWPLMQAFARAIAERRMRDRGLVPPSWRATVECAQCGPVPHWAERPPRLLGCPWCWNRLRGLPMPPAPA